MLDPRLGLKSLDPSFPIAMIPAAHAGLKEIWQSWHPARLAISTLSEVRRTRPPGRRRCTRWRARSRNCRWVTSE